ncbi:hypothetical protein RUND412_011604, partial [Rhizina undulata]
LVCRNFRRAATPILFRKTTFALHVEHNEIQALEPEGNVVIEKLIQQAETARLDEESMLSMIRDLSIVTSRLDEYEFYENVLQNIAAAIRKMINLRTILWNLMEVTRRFSYPEIGERLVACETLKDIHISNAFPYDEWSAALETRRYI